MRRASPAVPALAQSFWGAEHQSSVPPLRKPRFPRAAPSGFPLDDHTVAGKRTFISIASAIASACSCHLHRGGRLPSGV